MNNTISLDIDKKCICRYNNFKLCNRNINGVEFCRYHKNTKNCYIHKIFYDVFKSKNEININELNDIKFIVVLLNPFGFLLFLLVVK